MDDVHCLDSYLPGQNRFDYPSYLAGRSMIVKKVKRIDIECVVRGYLAGSAWAEYQQYSTISGIPLPKGLQESQELPQPLLTPTTKAESGHDQPLTMDEMKRLVGEALAEELKEKSLVIYNYAREYAKARDIIIADTKIEFGFDGDGGPATEASMGPWDVVVGTQGTLYIADNGNHRIRKVDTSGIITTVAGGGNPPDGLGDGGPATQARLYGPSGVAVDALGNLYIADRENNCIRKVDPNGIITTIAGTAIAGCWEEGMAIDTNIGPPHGLSVDSSGNIYRISA